MIADTSVQTIRDAARIEDVVSDFVALRKRGASLIGLCPFHHERSPSFHVHPVRGIYKCFGCGQGGDVFAFLQAYEAMSFHEAARWLAKRYNIEVAEVQHSPEQAAEQHEAETLHIINEFAGKYYAWLLTGTDRGQSVAGQYLLSRGIHAPSIEKYSLGYASGPNDLLYWLRKRGYSIPYAVQAGLCDQSAARDFMQERIIFPIHNLSGKIIAFAGRTIPPDTNKNSHGTDYTKQTLPSCTPLPSGGGDGGEVKYLNTPESPIYQKSKTLYGLFQARKAIRQQEECILVEGYLDVISLYQVGIENVVASCGTALTEGQLQLIRRNTTRLTILYDGDPAGIRAALRGLDLALEQGLDIRIVLLPDGEDPDSFARKVGGDQLRIYLADQAKDFVLFKVDLLWSDAQGDPARKAEAVKNIVDSIARIPDAIKRSVYIQECAALVQVSETVLTGEVIKIITARQQQAFHKRAPHTVVISDLAPATGNALHPAPSEQDDYPVERDITRLLIQYGGQPLADDPSITITEYILENLGDLETLPALFENPLYREIVKACLSLIDEKKIITEYYFLSHPLPAVRNLAQELVDAEWPTLQQWPILEAGDKMKASAALSIEAKHTLARFKVHKLTGLLAQNHERIQQCPPDDTETMDRYFRIGRKIKEARNQIAHEHSIIII